MNVEYTLIRELKPYPNNARSHSRKQIRKIARSIERFGFNNPVLINDHKQIIAGHGRVEAAKLLGMHAVPTVRLSHLSESDTQAYILADNKLALEAGWDREILAIELQGLVALDYDIELTGFEMAEVDLILDDAKEASEPEPGPEDEAPAYGSAPRVSRAGDHWLLGQHRLLCGDAREQAAYDTVLQGQPAAFVFSDPPYNVKIDGHVSRRRQVRHNEFAMASGEMSRPQFTDFLETIFRQLATNTIPGSIHALCMDWRHMLEMLTAGEKVYSELKNVCVWNKTNAGMGAFYRSQHELVFLWKNGTAPHVNNFELGQHGRHRSNIWVYPGATSMHASRKDELAMHPTVKPVALVSDAIKDLSLRGDTVSQT